MVPLLNGVDNAGRLRDILPRGIILNGGVYISSHIVGPGVIQQTGGSCNLIFGPENGDTDLYKEIELFLRNAGIDAVLSNDITMDVWSKYLFICSLAGITSMLKKPFGAIIENDAYTEMLKKAMYEIESIARAHNINFPEDIVESPFGILSNFPYETKSSLQIDFEKGKRTEVETFTGYIVKASKKLGVKTPLNDLIYSKLTSQK